MYILSCIKNLNVPFVVKFAMTMRLYHAYTSYVIPVMKTLFKTP